jgi:hypothetical protein
MISPLVSVNGNAIKKAHQWVLTWTRSELDDVSSLVNTKWTVKQHDNVIAHL